MARFFATAGNLWDGPLDRVALAECDRATLLRRLDDLQRELRHAEGFCADWRERAWAAERRLAERGERVDVQVPLA